MGLERHVNGLAQRGRNTSLNTARRWWMRWSLGWCLGSVLTLASAAPSDFVLVAHPSVKLDSIGLTDLRALFALRKRQFPDGTPVTLVVFDDQDPRHRAFATQVLNVFPYVLRENWDSQVFSGAARAPIQVTSSAELVAKVASTRGALGYVGSKEKMGLEGVRYVEIR